MGKVNTEGSMSIYLNTSKPLENYKELFNEKYFIDKSQIIELLNDRISTKSKYVCITRPRRFGKSSVADMLGAYYSKAVDSKGIFNKLNISKVSEYEEYLNKYNVIHIDIQKLRKIHQIIIKRSFQFIIIPVCQKNNNNHNRKHNQKNNQYY